MDFFFFFNQKYVRPELITSVSNYFTIHLNLDRWESVLVDSSGQQLPHTDAHKSLSAFTLIFLSFLSISLLLLSAHWLAQFLVFLFLLMSFRSTLVSYLPPSNSFVLKHSFTTFPHLRSLRPPSEPALALCPYTHLCLLLLSVFRGH